MVLDVLRAVQASGLELRLFHDGTSSNCPPPGDVARPQSGPQVDDDLGARMAAAFADCFAAGWDRVLLAGSDLPGLDSVTFRAAASGAVRRAPAHPGRRLRPVRPARRRLFPIFHGYRLEHGPGADHHPQAPAPGRMRVQLLPVQGDIDTINDLRSLPDSRPRTQRTPTRFSASGYAATAGEAPRVQS